MNTIKLLVCVLLVGFDCTLAQSQDGAVLSASINPDSALVQALAKIEGEQLALADAKNLASENSTTVNRAFHGMRSAKGLLQATRGEFDPELFAEHFKSGADTPNSSPFGGAPILETEQSRTLAGLRMLLPIGTELEASISTHRLETNSAFAALNPEYSSTSLLQIIQPLLEGFGPVAKAGYSSAKREYDAAVARYEDARLAVETEVENKYWDLYAAERDLAVQMLIHERGTVFLEQATLRARAGLVGPSDVAKARVFVADQEQQVLDRQEELDRISDELSSMIGTRPKSQAARFRPADEPTSRYDVATNVDGLLSDAFEKNLTVQAAEMDVAAARALESGGKWNMWPTVDLVASIGGNGLAGVAQEIEFGGDTVRSIFDGDRSEAFSQALNREYPTWSIGVRFEMPIGLRSGRGNRDFLIAERMRREQVLIDTRRSLEEDVRAYHRELLHAEQRLKAANEGVDASEEQVRIGILEYSTGRISAVDLVLLAEDLAKAQQSLTRARVKAAKANSELRRLTNRSELLGE